jgi:hypothetical protein
MSNSNNLKGRAKKHKKRNKKKEKKKNYRFSVSESEE